MNDAMKVEKFIHPFMNKHQENILSWDGKYSVRTDNLTDWIGVISSVLTNATQSNLRDKWSIQNSWQ